MEYVLCALAGLVVGGVVAWLLATVRSARAASERAAEIERRAQAAENRACGAEAALSEKNAQIAKLSDEAADLSRRLSDESGARIRAETQLAETITKLADEKKLLEQAQAKLADTFKALAGDTLNASTGTFLNLAKEALDKMLSDARGDLGKRQEAISGLVKPLSESIAKFEEHVRALEKNRQEAYAGLSEHLKLLSSSQQQLQKETSNLVTALRRPEVRGRWGEMTLRRVVELAGMSEHCDFAEQVSVATEEGRRRPDLIVRLPAGREIVVDAKVSLDAYLDAAAAESEEARAAAMGRHAGQVRSHMNTLASKAYWGQFPNAPEFVVMFIPGESFFGAAVDADHALIEDGLAQRVVLATPTTLIALLRAVAYGWRQERLSQNSQAIHTLGKELYERMKKLAEHIGDIGAKLKAATKAYNETVGSLEGRVLPAARRFRELGAAGGEEIDEVAPLDQTPREITSPELKTE